MIVSVIVLTALIFILILKLEYKLYRYPTYKDIRYTAMREEELYKVIETELEHDPHAVEEARKELLRRGVKTI